jgi:transcriptional regulator with XRE-family HTH domain
MDGRALLAWNLRRVRAAQGVSQERLAADAGVSRAHMSEIERENASATVDLLERLADVLGVELAEFFKKPEPGAKRPKALPVGRKRQKR